MTPCLSGGERRLESLRPECPAPRVSPAGRRLPVSGGRRGSVWGTHRAEQGLCDCTADSRSEPKRCGPWDLPSASHGQKSGQVPSRLSLPPLPHDHTQRSPSGGVCFGGGVSGAVVVAGTRGRGDEAGFHFGLWTDETTPVGPWVSGWKTQSPPFPLRLPSPRGRLRPPSPTPRSGRDTDVAGTRTGTRGRSCRRSRSC